MRHTNYTKPAVLIMLLLSSIPHLAQPWFTTGQKATLMVSGKGFNNSGGSLLFNHPNGMASDGTRLFLCDRFNNRVLVWNTIPVSAGVVPDVVLGQPDFISNNSGTGKHQMNFPGNVSVANGVVVVADTDNDRILIWNNIPSVSGKPADVEINLVGLTPVGTQLQYRWPWGVWTNGQKLVVAATGGGVLLFWNSLPQNGTTAPDYTISNSFMGTPRNISTDGSSYFFVGDHNSGATKDKAGTFFWNTFPTQTNQPFSFYTTREAWIKGVKLPDGKLIAGGATALYIWNTVPTDSSHRPDVTVSNPYYKNGDGPDVVFAAGKLFVNNYNGNNIQVYNTVPTSTTQQPDFTIGSPSFTSNTLDSLQYIQNPVVSTNGSILLATSDFDRSLWIWRSIPQISGKAPDVKIKLQWGNNDIQPWDNALWKNTLVVGGKNKVAVWNMIPVNGEAPNLIFTGSIGNFSLQEVMGIALDGQYLYIANKNGQVGVWQGIPANSSVNPIITFTISASTLNRLSSDGTYFTATVQDGNPRAAYIYKVAQLSAGVIPTPYKTIAGSPSFNLNLPTEAITFHNSFALCNLNSNQVLLWKNIEDAGDTSKMIILGQKSFRQLSSGISDSMFRMPASLAYSDSTLWVGEFKFSSRLMKFVVPGTVSEVEVTTAPTGFQLYANYPNPFNPSTNIVFQISELAEIQIEIFNTLGERIKAVNTGVLEAGKHSVSINASEMPSGVYVYTVAVHPSRKFGSTVLSGKMTVLR